MRGVLWLSSLPRSSKCRSTSTKTSLMSSTVVWTNNLDAKEVPGKTNQFILECYVPSATHAKLPLLWLMPFRSRRPKSVCLTIWWPGVRRPNWSPNSTSCIEESQRFVKSWERSQMPKRRWRKKYSKWSYIISSKSPNRLQRRAKTKKLKVKVQMLQQSKSLMLSSSGRFH